MSDPFLDAAGQPRVLRGVSVISGAPRLVELAARLGFETVWIEVEHAGASFIDVEVQCMAIEAGGAVPTVRIPDGNRHHVLRALECGGRLVVVPLVNNAAIARGIVEYGKFPPLGKRGYNTRSRGLRYGLAGVPEIFAEANATTHLIAQIETKEAVDNLDEILAVEGISGILVGPGDLSADLGIGGQFDDPDLIAMVVDCIKRGRAAGKHAGLLVASGPMLRAAFDAGCDLVFSGGDVGELAVAWKKILDNLH